MAKIARPNRPLADVNVIPQKDGSAEVIVCFMPDPDILLGEKKEARAVLALDASRSIKKMFGLGGPFGGDPNYVELVARKLGDILCNVSRPSKVSMLYWAVGAGGDQIQPIGEFDEASCRSANVAGPKTWGTGTKMLPPLKHIIDGIASKADWTMGVIITDGIIEDEKDCMDYCMKVGKELAAGKRKEIKLVLVGVGEEVDEGQLERFDDMFEGSGIDVDLWSHGVASSMRDESDIIGVLFGELMTEELEIADSGSVSDGAGNEIQSFEPMPGKFRFVLPKGATSFTVHTPRGDVTQDVSEALKP